jgi:hypothetical protein
MIKVIYAKKCEYYILCYNDKKIVIQGKMF